MNHRLYYRLNNSDPGKKTSQPLSLPIWRSVTIQLFLSAVLPLTVLVLIVTFGSLRLHHDAMRALVADRNLRAVQSTAAYLSNEINHRGKTLELLSREIGSTQPVQEVLSLAKEDLKIFEGGVMAFDMRNLPIAQVDGSAIEKLIASKEWPQVLSSVRKANADAVHYLPIQRIENKVYVPVAVSTSTGIFLLGLFLPDSLLSNNLTDAFSENGVRVLVVEQDYEVLYQSGEFNSVEALSTHPGIKTALAGQSGIDYSQANDGEHVITTSTIQPVGWALMFEESWENIASPLLRITEHAPLIFIPILAFSLLALWFGLRRIVQPMRALEGKAICLAQGNFDAIRQRVGGVHEIQHLQNTLIGMADQLKEAQSSLHGYIGAITDSVEGERRHLARELHDETLQTLIALGQYTQYALHWNKDPKVEKTLNQIVELVDHGTSGLHRLVRGLRPIYIEDLGLATALEMQASNHNLPNDVHVQFQQEGDERRLKPEVEMALYRIVQEALSNIRRHADAKNAWITLFYRKSDVILEIRDDGIGFSITPDPLRLARQGHYGLLSLYERAELIGAKLTIQSASGEGTLIRVRLLEKEH